MTSSAVTTEPPRRRVERDAALSDSFRTGEPAAQRRGARLAVGEPRAVERTWPDPARIPHLADGAESVSHHGAPSVRTAHALHLPAGPAPAHVSPTDVSPAPSAPVLAASSTAGRGATAPLPHPWPELWHAPAPAGEALPAPLFARQLARARRLMDEQAAV